VHYNSVINTLAKIAKIHFIEIDNELLSQDQRIKMALKIFEEMVTRKCEPDSYTINAIVNVYCRSLRIKRARKVLLKLSQKYKIKPSYFTYMSLLRACSRLKRLDSAMELLEVMKKKNDVLPDHETYRILLVLCRRMRDLKRGQAILCEANEKGFKMSEFDAKFFESKEPSLFEHVKEEPRSGQHRRRKKESHKVGWVSRRPIKRFL